MSNIPLAERGYGGDPYQRNLDLPPFPEFAEGYFPSSVHVHFHLTPHRLAEHIDEFPPLLAQADIFASENSGWNEKRLRDTIAISKGELRTLEKIKQASDKNINAAWTNALLDELYGTYKPVVFVDADESQKHMVIGDFSRRYRAAIGSDPDATMSGFADVLAVIAQGAYSRDLVIANTLGPTISKKVAEHPKLRGKDSVNVLYLLGFAHRHAFDALAAAPATASQVSVSVRANQYDADPESVLVKRYKDGGSPTRTELETFMIAYALSLVTIPSFNDNTLYDFAGSYYKRRPDAYDRAGIVMIATILSMGEEGLALAHRFIKNNNKREDNYLMLDIAKAALNEVQLSE